MFAEERKQQILEFLARRRSVRVSDLTAALGASEVSIRRDLRVLQEAGLLKRTHGGAVSHQVSGFEPSQSEKEDCFHEEKLAIAACAAGLVEAGETVLLDAGSTTLEIARLLKVRGDISIVTNALNIAQELAHGHAEFVLTGGSLRRRTLAFVGPVAEAALAAVNVDKLFLAANGLDLKKGLTTPNLLEAGAKRAMVESAREVIVVLDGSKFGRVTFSRICGLDRVHCVITDSGASSGFVGALQSRGLRVLLAGGGQNS